MDSKPIFWGQTPGSYNRCLSPKTFLTLFTLKSLNFVPQTLGLQIVCLNIVKKSLYSLTITQNKCKIQLNDWKELHIIYTK